VKQTPLKKEFLDQAKGECKDLKDTPFLALAHQNQYEFITSVDQKDLLSSNRIPVVISLAVSCLKNYAVLDSSTH